MHVLKEILTREINRLKVEKPKILVKTQTSTFSEMGDTDYLNLVARRKHLKKILINYHVKNLKDLQKLIEKQVKNQQYMNNIFKEN